MKREDITFPLGMFFVLTSVFIPFFYPRIFGFMIGWEFFILEHLFKEAEK